MKKIQVNIPSKNIKYKIIFTKDIFTSFRENIRNTQKKKILFVIDDNLFSLYKSYFGEEIKKLGASYLLIKNGEENKNYKTVFSIIDELIKYNFTRKDYIIALGGGVTGDITGFAASLFKRGINLIQVPTTLLSMCDSSVGGKTGIDYKSIKNCIGTFYNPRFIFVDKKFLATLPKAEIMGGFFEGLKHTILDSKKSYFSFRNAYEFLENKNNKKIEKLIRKNIAYKLRIVKSDPYEKKGKRKILNYGHTFGHALEASMDFKLNHGTCVAFGIIFANMLAQKLGFLKKEVAEEINSHLKKLLNDIKIKKLDFEEIYTYMQNDKKNESEYIQFILIKNYGKVFLYDIEKEDLKVSFDLFKKKFII